MQSNALVCWKLMGADQQNPQTRCYSYASYITIGKTKPPHYSSQNSVASWQLLQSWTIPGEEFVKEMTAAMPN